ncbi:MAG: methyltransferase domain-containing protein [Paracoccaceae bacterium]|nr:methyltransferase domain-containing protein [Paracoccaceae bacterium]
MEAEGGELYHSKLIGMLEAIWGTGFLSPGGPDEIARLVAGTDFTGANVLDVGCGAGGIDMALVQNHGAAYVCGIDVEDTVLSRARELISAVNLTPRIGCLKVVPGPLPFPPDTFDIVFSKDSIVHIPDKHALMREVFRVLKPGGRFVASDWLIGHDGTPSPEMAEYIASEGLDFGMASGKRYADAMKAAGFTDIEVVSRNEWYKETAKTELARLKGPIGHKAASIVGQEFVDENIGIWGKMLVVLNSGEHCPTHLRARKTLS